VFIVSPQRQVFQGTSVFGDPNRAADRGPPGSLPACPNSHNIKLMPSFRHGLNYLGNVCTQLTVSERTSTDSKAAKALQPNFCACPSLLM
jgi:hypothetical protein